MLRMLWIGNGHFKGIPKDGRGFGEADAVLREWSSQDSVDTSLGPSVSRFELTRAHAIEVAVPT